MKNFTLSICTMVLFLPIFSQAEKTANQTKKFPTVEEVWQHHIESWVKRDLDAITADYDKDSFMIINNVIYKGPKQIKKVFATLFKTFDDGKNRIDPVIIKGRVIYIVWYFTPKGDKEYFGTDTFIVENGKIKVQTIASLLYKKFPITK